MKEELMTIGELAKQMRVTVRTLQYYDSADLLKPSARSEGGRRLYSSKDLVVLHQILSFKNLGFSLGKIKTMLHSLDDPKDVVSILGDQQKVLEEEVGRIQEAINAISNLRNEVLQMDKVDFKKYAEILELIRMDNESYWVWKCFDDSLTEHIIDRFANNHELGFKILKTYQELLDEADILQKQGIQPDSVQGHELAKKWWDMVTDFTGGDMSLIPKLVEFNDDRSNWNQEMNEKQTRIDSFIGEAMGSYFTKNNIGEMG